MEKKTLILIILSAVSIILISGVIVVKVSRIGDRSIDADGKVYAATPGSINLDENQESDEYTYIPPTLEGQAQDTNPTTAPLEEEIEEPFVPATEMDLDVTSITVFVNKEYSLPKDYKPSELVVPNVVFNFTYYDERTLMRPEAASALEKLFNAAKKDGVILYGVSGFRSYARQYKIFTTNIATKGKTHTLRYSAVPGTSEHQTGLAIDVSCKSLDFDLSTSFSTSPEGIWLAKNAHYYGYIIRYPKGMADVTGYAYEPWHIRYVGKGLANYLYTNNLTLEEYYHYTPSPGFDFEAKYASLINYIPPNITTIPTDDMVLGENGEIIDEAIGDNTLPTVTPEEPMVTITITPSPTPTQPPEYVDEQEQGDDTSNSGEDDTTPDATNPPSDLTPIPTLTHAPSITHAPSVTVSPTPTLAADPQAANQNILYPNK